MNSNIRTIKRSHSITESEEEQERKRFESDFYGGDESYTPTVDSGLIVNIKKEEELIISPEIDSLHNLDNIGTVACGTQINDHSMSYSNDFETGYVGDGNNLGESSKSYNKQHNVSL